MTTGMALVGGLVIAFAVLNWTNRSCSGRSPRWSSYSPWSVGAFWNSTSSAGFPAQAVKSVVAPSSERDQADQYRAIENLDVVFTVKASPSGTLASASGVVQCRRCRGQHFGQCARTRQPSEVHRGAPSACRHDGADRDGARLRHGIELVLFLHRHWPPYTIATTVTPP